MHLCLQRGPDLGLERAEQYLKVPFAVSVARSIPGVGCCAKVHRKNISFKCLPFINLPEEAEVMEAREKGTVHSDWVRHLDILT